MQKSTFSYDANGNRYKQVKQLSGSVVSTTYYVCSFEREVTLSSTVDKTYIGDHTIKMKAHVGSLGNQSPFQHVLRDHLGCVDTLMDARTGAVLQHRGYDVFGRPRDIAAGIALLSGTNWQGVTKGYTDHEHLIDQELIHMNGRIYDFNIGRFLSVDPFLQFPENSQSANPYSYILNNPMSGVDPTGYSAVRSGNASAWRVASCDSNYGNSCAKTPVNNIMAQWGLSNGQSNESLAKQSQQRRNQKKEDKADASSASGNIEVSIDNSGLNEVTQTKLSPAYVTNRQLKARELIKGVSFSKMGGQDPLGKQKQFFEDLDAIAITDQFYEFVQYMMAKESILICVQNAKARAKIEFHKV